MFESKFMLSSVIASINARLLGTAERLLQEEARAAQELREQRELEGGAMLVYGTRHLDARNEADCLSQDDPYDNHGKPAPLDLGGMLRNYANMRHMLASKLESVATSHYDKPQSLGSTMAFMIGQAPDGTFRDAKQWAAEQVERDAKDGRYAQVAALLNDGGEEIITPAQLIEAAKLDRQKQIETTRHNAGKIIARANEAMLDARNEIVAYDEDFTDLVTNLPSEVRDALVAKFAVSLGKAKARAASVALKRMDVAMEEIASLRLDTEYVLQLKRASGEAYRAEQQAGVVLSKAKEEPAALTPAQKAAITRKANKEKKAREAQLAAEVSASRQANKAARLAAQ